MNIDPHHIQRTQDLYSAMDETAEFARNNPMPKPKRQQMKTNQMHVHLQRVDMVETFLMRNKIATSQEIAVHLKLERDQARHLLSVMEKRGVVQLACVPDLGTDKTWRLSPHGMPQEAPDTVVAKALANRHPILLAWLQPVEVVA